MTDLFPSRSPAAAGGGDRRRHRRRARGPAAARRSQRLREQPVFAIVARLRRGDEGRAHGRQPARARRRPDSCARRAGASGSTASTAAATGWRRAMAGAAAAAGAIAGAGFDRGGRGDRGFRGGGPDRGGFGAFQSEFAQVMVNGVVAGIVAVPREPPPMSAAIRDLGPTLAMVALALLAGGTAVASLVIVRPTRRRLRQLQEAARAIGAGAAGVRAPVSGGDEVTSLVAGVQRDGRAARATHARARDGRPYPPAAAGRCLARADRRRSPRFSGTSRRCAWRTWISTRRPASATSASSMTKPTGWSTSSAICSSWRAWRAAAGRCGASASRLPICSNAFATGTRRSLPTSTSRSRPSRIRSSGPSWATRTGSSRRCRISWPMPSVTRPGAGR